MSYKLCVMRFADGLYFLHELKIKNHLSKLDDAECGRLLYRGSSLKYTGVKYDDTDAWR
jgi:hypothetical protein